jgi:D-alanyl-D-alanine carboxypeptidase (penicillin-binding protein 5/6)
MNERAKELGMLNTQFDNCTGLDDDTTEHLTTAYDIALAGRELLKHDIVTKYSVIWMDSLRGGATELVNCLVAKKIATKQPLLVGLLVKKFGNLLL